VRGHQVVEDGYEFLFDRKVVTLFSAPNYCGEFDNCGAMMTVDNNMKCSFKLLKPIQKSKLSNPKRQSRVSVAKKIREPGRVSFGRVSISDLVEAEKRADRKSFFHKSFFSEEDGLKVDTAGSFTMIQFSEEPPKVVEIEDLSRKYTTWGDIWEDLFWDEAELAEFKYEAYEEQLARLEEEDNY
jgi:hypothetical protein